MFSFQYTPPGDVAAFLRSRIHPPVLTAQTLVSAALRFLMEHSPAEIEVILLKFIIGWRPRQRGQPTRGDPRQSNPPEQGKRLNLILGEKLDSMDDQVSFMNREKKGPRIGCCSDAKTSYG